MIKQYFKNTIYQLRNYPLLNCITIFGSALAIALIMVILIVYHAKTADYAPESNRSRSLYVKWGRTVYSDGNAGHGPLSLWAANELFGELKTPEAITFINNCGISKLISSSSDKEIDGSLVLTDDKFWKVHNFQLLSGNFFTEADSESGLKKCVIVKDVARKLYGNENEAVGKSIKINFAEYEICGVVDNVNRFCERSWGEVYAPYNSNVQESKIVAGFTQHNYQIIILAHSTDDFDAIRNEISQSLARFNTIVNDGSRKKEIQKYELMGQPDTFRAQLLRKYANQYGDLAEFDWYYVIVIIVILLIPAINLSGLTNTRMRRRLEELGIRRAFGAARGSIVLQILNENFILTLIGGIVGLGISYLSLWLMGDWLLQTTYGESVATMNTSMISPIIFLIAIIFCLVLNLLSAFIPAWRVTRTPIVDSLNQKS